MRFKLKHTEVDAIQNTGDNLEEIKEFVSKNNPKTVVDNAHFNKDGKLIIRGFRPILPKEWLTIDYDGTFLAYLDEQFRDMYDSVDKKESTNQIKFFAIRQSKESDLFWHQAAGEWTHICNCDKFPNVDYAKELIAIQPYMAKFFKDSVIEEFYITKGESHEQTI